MNKKQKLLLVFQYCWAWYNVKEYMIRPYTSHFSYIREYWYSLDFWFGFILTIILFPIFALKHFVITPIIVYRNEKTDRNYLQEIKKFKFDEWEYKDYKRNEKRKKLLGLNE